MLLVRGDYNDFGVGSCKGESIEITDACRTTRNYCYTSSQVRNLSWSEAATEEGSRIAGVWDEVGHVGGHEKSNDVGEGALAYINQTSPDPAYSDTR